MKNNNTKYQIICINPPATTKSKVELPGDPVSLYHALRLMIYNVQHECGYSSNIPDVKNPIDLIYDPRIWDEKTKKEFREKVKQEKPKLALFCVFSPTHAYALDMARIIKEESEDCIIVFGGKHIDETIKYNASADTYRIESVNTLKLILDNKINDIVDFIISGDGEYLLDYFVKNISIMIGSNINEVKNNFLKKEKEINKLPGNSIIGFIKNNQLRKIHTSNTLYGILDLPSVYSMFPIKVRNPIFNCFDSKYTVNIITQRGCPNSCCWRIKE